VLLPGIDHTHPSVCSKAPISIHLPCVVFPPAFQGRWCQGRRHKFQSATRPEVQGDEKDFVRYKEVSKLVLVNWTKEHLLVCVRSVCRFCILLLQLWWCLCDRSWVPVLVPCCRCFGTLGWAVELVYSDRCASDLCKSTSTGRWVANYLHVA
jgi:hypothetical protein